MQRKFGVKRDFRWMFISDPYIFCKPDPTLFWKPDPDPQPCQISMIISWRSLLRTALCYEPGVDVLSYVKLIFFPET